LRQGDVGNATAGADGRFLCAYIKALRKLTRSPHHERLQPAFPMELVYANEPLPVRQIKSIFLAGPSPRRLAVEDWRHRAVHLLDKVGYDGHLFVPCPRDVFEGAEVESPWSFDGQVAWEVAARQQSDVICYWMARRIDRGWVDLGLPGFTSNFQLGEDLATGRVAYGRPPGSEKNTYLDARMRERGMRARAARSPAGRGAGSAGRREPARGR